MTDIRVYISKKYPYMKKIAFAAVFIAFAAMLFASCSSSRKTGCPNSPQSNYRFRG